MRTACLLLCVLGLPLSAQAQAQASASETIENVPAPSWAKAILESFSKPLHPVIGGVATNGGVGAGIAYSSPAPTGWFQEAKAMMTLRHFWLLEGEVGRRSPSSRSQVGAFGAVRDMGRLDYFGIGPDSARDNRASFRLRETTMGARGWFRPGSFVRVGGSISAYQPNFGPTTSSTIRAIESVFTDGSIPAFSDEPLFGRYRGVVEFRHPTPEQAEPLDDVNRYRGIYQFAFEAMRDYGSGRHNLHRVETEVQQRIPGFRPNQRLTLHGLIASTNSTADVPFYLMYTLGGTGGLKTFRPEMLGSDGTRATLRGFRNFRFRDRNLVLMQAEYRIPLHKYVHSTVFVDAGQVAPRTSELFSNLRSNTGFSLSFVRKGKTMGRMDVGFGGGEGVLFFWSFGATPE